MSIPSPSLRIVLSRSGGLCEVCGTVGTQLHHRRPRGMGGSKDRRTNSPSNLLRVCGWGSASGCHLWIETNRSRAYDLGLLVQQHADPTGVPVLLLKPGWVLLDDIGQYLPVEIGAA